jgi:hypothetical protein
MDGIDIWGAIKQGRQTELYCETCAPPYHGYFPGRFPDTIPFDTVAVSYSTYKNLLNAGDLKPHSVFEISIYENISDYLKELDN